MIIWNGLNFGEGWLPDVAATEVPRFIAELDLKPLAAWTSTDTSSLPDKVDMTAALNQLWGPNWYLNQGECGSCVAFGAALCCDALMALETVKNGRPKPPYRTAPEPIYWGSRVEIGGGKIRGEGSVGVWAAEYLKRYGALPQKPFPEIDLSKYSPSVCCGPLSRRGVPDTLEPTARLYPVKTYAQVRTWDECITALANGYPVTVASNQGFRMQLDAQGFATASGTWMHQMAVVGYELKPTPCLIIANSWGACYTGGPPGWCPAVKKVRKSTAERMLKQGDSWALSDFQNFAPKGIDWERLNF